MRQSVGLPVIDKGMRRWYESCSCCLSGAYPDDREQAARQVRSLERQDANLRRALRTASVAAADRIPVELDAVAVELGEAKRRAEGIERESRPHRITTKLVRELIGQMTALLDHAPLETRVAWVRGPVRADRRRWRRTACHRLLEGTIRSGC